MEDIIYMKHRIIHMLSKMSIIIAPLTYALAIMTSNSTCYFFTYQPPVPSALKRNIDNHDQFALKSNSKQMDN